MDGYLLLWNLFRFIIILAITMYAITSYMDRIEQNKYNIGDYVTYERKGTVKSGIIVSIQFTRIKTLLLFSGKTSSENTISYRIAEDECILKIENRDYKKLVLVNENYISHREKTKESR